MILLAFIVWYVFGVALITAQANGNSRKDFPILYSTTALAEEQFNSCLILALCLGLMWPISFLVGQAVLGVSPLTFSKEIIKRGY